jgi:hypothetical protein
MNVNPKPEARNPKQIQMLRSPLSAENRPFQRALSLGRCLGVGACFGFRVSGFGFLVCAVSLLAGCAVGPDYKRPAVNAPTVFRGELRTTRTAPVPTSSLTRFPRRITELYKHSQ